MRKKFAPKVTVICMLCSSFIQSLELECPCKKGNPQATQEALKSLFVPAFEDYDIAVS